MAIDSRRRAQLGPSIDSRTVILFPPGTPSERIEEILREQLSR
ncbi:MAG TPA: hypothetical protein VFT23_13595 [Burkholderiales bacterium]|nr:hypothetical protein [Burkholderiales bacterium]